MTQPKPQILQTYTLLQIATEAFFDGADRGDPAATPQAGVPFNLHGHRCRALPFAPSPSSKARAASLKP